MADITRARLPPLHLHSRNLSTNTDDSESSDSSPERENDEVTEYFLAHANDSQSTIGPATTAHGYSKSVDIEQRHRLTPISKLPPELLIAIFSKLTTTADLRNCMLVSYHWALYSVSILWHRPLCNKWSSLENVAMTLAENRPTFPYHEMVKRLNLSAVADKVNDGTAQAFMGCKNIERLTLTSCSKLTDFGVAGLVEGGKRLQALDVTDLDSLTDRTLLVVADNCMKLQGLNITNCSNITDDSLVAIAENCRQLKRLKLNGVFRATDYSLVAVAENCRSILEIDLAGCQSITSESVTALLSNLPYLRELRLAHCSEVTDSAFTNLSPKAHFDALRILDLTACEQVRDDAIARIIPAAPRLRNLVLAKCKHITDQAVNSICKLTKNLHYIHLGHCTNLTDAAVINLVKHCNRIRYIDLACCSRLTDASVRHLAQLPKLRRVGLVKCQNLTDSSIMALAHGPVMFSSSGKIGMPTQFVSLERVHLSYCVNLTLKGITALLHNCPRLTHLSLTGVQAFLREDLTRFCRDAPAEFTHPQRDVFCVFSGDGVTRLRDYLMRLAIEEAERETQNAIEENLLDPEDSPGADTMSDEGTIDGNDQGMDLIYSPGRNGMPSVSGSRARARPRSLHDFTNFHVEMPLLQPDQMTRMGPWTPSGPLTPEMRANMAPAHLNLMSSSILSHPEANIRTRSPAPPPYDAEGMREDRLVSRNQSRRHTMESSSGGFGLPDPAMNYTSSPRLFDPNDDPRRSTHHNVSISTPSRRSNIPATNAAVRPGMSTRGSSLRPEPGFSAFEANHDAIMSTIPSARGPSQEPSRSNSPGLPRTSSRSRMSNLLGSMRALAYAEASTRHHRSTGSREPSRQRDTHREAMLRSLGTAEGEMYPRYAFNSSTSDRGIELPLLPPELMEQIPMTPVTSTDPSGRVLEETPSRTSQSNNHDVDMTP